MTSAKDILAYLIV